MGIKFKYFSIRSGHGKRMKNKKHPDGAMWFNPDYADKLKIFKNGKWVETNPFKDLEERKVKK